MFFSINNTLHAHTCTHTNSARSRCNVTGSILHRAVHHLPHAPNYWTFLIYDLSRISTNRSDAGRVPWWRMVTMVMRTTVVTLVTALSPPYNSGNFADHFHCPASVRNLYHRGRHDNTPSPTSITCHVLPPVIYLPSTIISQLSYITH